MRRTPLLKSIGVSVLGVSVVFVGCSLGLDESKLGVRPGGVGVEGAVLPGADASSDTGVEAGPRPDGPTVPGVPAGQCRQNEDCVAANNCLRGRCDTASRTCLYEVCPQANACSSSTCDVPSATCSLPVTYGFRASAFPVARGGVTCSGSLGRCFAAVWPFVFVGTVNGLIAYSVADPANGAPTPVLVAGLGFVPQLIVASGRRLYILGNPIEAAPDYRLAVAWIDVPGDPVVDTLAARSLFVAYPHSSLMAAYPTVDGGIFVVNGDSSRLFPTAILRAPLRDGEAIATFPLAGIAAGALPIGASGTRIVSYRYDGAPRAFAAFFALQAGAGTALAQGGSEQSAAALGFIAGQPSLAQGPDGSLLFSAPALSVVDAGAEAVRATWLVENATTAAFDANARVDVETYPPATQLGAQFVGPMAWLDAKRALVTAALKDDRKQTVVQVISRVQLPPSVLPNRRFFIGALPGNIGAAASEGIGYVLALDSPEGVTVHVFAPACPP